MSSKAQGAVYAFETDTVWGFGCAPDDSAAVERIYEIKGRDRSKPLILMCDNLDSLLKYVQDVPQSAMDLMQKAYPGAFTVVLKKSPLCPESICAGFDTVGIRVPNCPWPSKGEVLATTSANISNEPPVESYNEALWKFGSVCTVIKPQDTQTSGAASTVVAFSPDGSYKILRQGDYKLI